MRCFWKTPITFYIIPKTNNKNSLSLLRNPIISRIHKPKYDIVF